MVATFGRWWHRLSPLVGLGLFGVAIMVLGRELKQMPPRELVQAMRDAPSASILLASAFTLLNYLILTGYDQLAFVYIGRPIARWQIAVASFVGYAIANNVGFALLSGTSARYRFYSRWGLSGLEISRVVLFYSGTFWLGLIVVGGWSLAGGSVHGIDNYVPPAIARLIGWVLLLTAFSYPVFALVRREPVRVAGMEFPLPAFGLVIAQFVLSALDWALAAAVLYALVPGPRPDFLFFLGAFLAAQLIALVSHVPGGLGVFESLMILMLQLPATVALPALALFRVIYYLVPLTGALVILIVDEISQRRHQVVQWGNAFGTLTASVAPKLVAVFVMMAGAVLLFSSATPGEPARLARLGHLLPLFVIELAHLTASVVGFGLLVVAWGLARRVNAAYRLGLVGLSIGVVASLLKGLDYEEATVLGALLVALMVSRDEFDRPSRLRDVPLSPGWIAAALGIVAASAAIGMFAFRRVGYTPALWWSFELGASAPRFLRAMAAVVTVMALGGLRRLIRPPRPAHPLPAPEDLADAEHIVANAPPLPASLVLLGDKSLLWDERRTALLMYGVTGRTWVALSDPVGPSLTAEPLVARFLERCDDYQGLPVIFDASKDWLHVYGDFGLTFVRLGEQARVFLPHFAIEGSGYRILRTTMTLVARDGTNTRVLSPGEAGRWAPQLAEVSEAWLADRGITEPGFAVGRATPATLARTRVAIAEKGGRVEAFATVWPGPRRQEIALDVMRARPGAPRGVLDALGTTLITWARQDGYQWFSFGLTPPADDDVAGLTALWSRIARALPTPAEPGDMVQGIRAWRQKFDPVWDPRYVVYPGGVPLPGVLADVSALILRG
jgi:phosphatidylglycerol lysyltransferase